MARSLSAYGAKMYAEMQLAIAETYGVPLSSKMFSVEPSITQELNDAITAKADFLQRINVIPVTEIKGEKVFIGVSGPVTGRTNTKTTDREAKDASALENSTYELSSTESDVGLPYAKIDSLGEVPGLPPALLRCGAKADRPGSHHGRFPRHSKAAAQTDLAAHPMLQDVNKGWLQLRESRSPQQVLKEGKGRRQVTWALGGDYANLDALVHDTKQMVDERLRDGGDLIAIIGSDLLAADKAQAVRQAR
jgi:hypothetical protein